MPPSATGRLPGKPPRRARLPGPARTAAALLLALAGSFAITPGLEGIPILSGEGAATPSPGPPGGGPDPDPVPGTTPGTGTAGGIDRESRAPAPAREPGLPGLPLAFGIGYRGVEPMVAEGAAPAYAQLWAGVWNEQAGWGYVGTLAGALADAGVVPVVEWWYWGDDISRDCVKRGCHGDGAWKNRSNWRAGAAKLADALHEGLDGRPGIVVVETEFNKHGVGGWESFDADLATQAAIFRERAPEVRVAIGFGNWDRGSWGTFDRAAEAADLVGLQALRASTRDSPGSYLDAVDGLVDGATTLHRLFGKPVLIHDVALSTYPHSAWEILQDAALRDLVGRAGELRDAGVVGVVYRSHLDNPLAGLDNYHGVAERHWGLLRADGTAKAAYDTWLRAAARGVRETAAALGEEDAGDRGGAATEDDADGGPEGG